MKFSLITATLGRVSEFERLLQSLSAQTFKDFELIVVDQNEHFQLEEICNRFKNLNIKYIHSDKKGLSYNRNIGLKQAQGEIIAFPDDDCLYNDDTLEYVVNNIKNKELDYFCINWHDKTNPSAYHSTSSIKRYIKNRNFYEVGCSITLFVRKSTISDFLFDEQLGAGAKYGSGEETDLLLHCLKKNAKCFCDGTYYIHHPYKETTEINIKRSYNYALGYGAIMKKAFSLYHFRFVIFKFLFAILKNIAGIATKKRKHHITALKGKIFGFYSYKVIK